jgi:hypothetical protein
MSEVGASGNIRWDISYGYPMNIFFTTSSIGSEPVLWRWSQIVEDVCIQTEPIQNRENVVATPRPNMVIYIPLLLPSPPHKKLAGRSNLFSRRIRLLLIM